MKLSKITIVFLAVIGTVCSTGIVIRTVEQAESSELIAEAVANILTSCYGNEKFGIGLYGNLPETFIETLWSRTLIPIALINDTKCLYGSPNRLYHTRLNVFVIIATHWQQLFRGSLQIYCSRFFNRRASFLIVDWSPTPKYGCSGLNWFFFAMSEIQQIYNVNILCVHPTTGRTIFGFNPFTYQAPAPWQFSHTVLGQSRQKISVFKRKYTQKGVCKNLDFDKTNDLGGKGIVLTEDPHLFRFRMNPNKFNNASIVAGSKTLNIYSMFVRQLNGTPMYKLVPIFTSRDIVDLSSLPAAAEAGVFIEAISYPCMQTYLKITTNFEGYKSQLRKILTVVDSHSRFGTCLVLLVTLIFFKFVVGQALLPATLNIVRIVCNTGFENVPENSASRIYLTGVLFFVVTMQGIFTGNLASLLTTDVSVQHVQTIQDLIDRNYTIYVKEVFAHLFRDSIYNGHVIVLPSRADRCIDYLIRDPSGACVNPQTFSPKNTERYKFYTSEKVVSKLYSTFFTNFDWPLVEKFNKVLITMTEANIVDTFKMRLLIHRISFVEADDADPKVMTLNDLGFAFVILGIGLVCATVSFIVEISIKPIRPAIAKVRRKLFYCYRKIKSRKLRDRKEKKISVQRLAFQD